MHVPFLMICYGFAPVEIIATSLMAILFNVVTGSYCYYRQGKIDVVSGTKFGMASIPGAILGTFLTKYFSIRFFEILFGLLLLALGVYVFSSAILEAVLKISKGETLDRDKEDDDSLRPWKKVRQSGDGAEKLTKRIIRDSLGVKYVYRFNERLGLIISAVIGFVGPLIGVGGGVFHVPALTKILKFPTHIATATAHYVLFICVIFALTPYIFMDAVHYNVAIPIGIGSVFGARVGAKLSQQYTSQALFKLLSIVLFIISIRLLFFP